jgi:uncharacterized membrane protein
MFDSVVSHGVSFVAVGYQEEGGGAEEWCVRVWLLLSVISSYHSSVSYRWSLIICVLLLLLDAAGGPPFFPIIHHDIANEIPANVQRLQYLAFASWLGMFAFYCISDIIVVICNLI